METVMGPSGDLHDIHLKPPNHFPFPYKQYNIQTDFMRALYRVLEKKKMGVFESPTGTGKTLSILCAVLSWHRDNKKRMLDELTLSVSNMRFKILMIGKQTSDDWLTNQSQARRLTHKLGEIESDLQRMITYEKNVKKLYADKATTGKRIFSPLIIENDENDIKLTDDDLLIYEDVNTDPDTDTDECDDVPVQDEGYKPVQIIIASRTHSQLAQFITEINKTSFKNSVRVLTLGSRLQFCINDVVSKEKVSGLINDRCLELKLKSQQSTKSDQEGCSVKRKKACGCPYYNAERMEQFAISTLREVRDIEDLVKQGREMKACPYYGTRKAVKDAELILVPYNIILHKATREACGLELKNNILIIDEAHNLLDALTAMYSVTITSGQISVFRQQIRIYDELYNERLSAKNLHYVRQLNYLTTKMFIAISRVEDGERIYTVQEYLDFADIADYNLFKMIKFVEKSQIARKLLGLVLTNPELPPKVLVPKPSTVIRSSVGDFLARINLPPRRRTMAPSVMAPPPPPPIFKPKPVEKKIPPSSPILNIVDFLRALTSSAKDGRVYIKGVYGQSDITMQYLQLNPTSNFTDVVQECRSVVVAGGTMQPQREFTKRLFANAGVCVDEVSVFSSPHIVKKENIIAITVKTTKAVNDIRFDYQHRKEMGYGIEEVIQGACETVPGGIVAFFTSFTYLEFAQRFITPVVTDRALFIETRNTGPGLLEQFTKEVKKKGKALLCSVIGGKMSEGINFSDDLGRCIIVFGLPYPNATSVSLNEKMDYLDETEGLHSGKRYYNDVCFKAVNQAVGRAIRHRNDYAVVLLVDSRYTKSPDVKDNFPKWIRDALIGSDTFDEAMGYVAKFFEEKKSIYIKTECETVKD